MAARFGGIFRGSTAMWNRLLRMGQEGTLSPGNRMYSQVMRAIGRDPSTGQVSGSAAGFSGGPGGALYGRAVETGMGLLDAPESIDDEAQQQLISEAQNAINQQFNERARQLERSFSRRGLSGGALIRARQDLARERSAALARAPQEVIRERALRRGADVRSALGAVVPLLGHQARMQALSQSRPQAPSRTIGVSSPGGGRTWGFGPAGGLSSAFQRSFLGGLQSPVAGGLQPRFAQPAAQPQPRRQLGFSFSPGLSPFGAF